MAGISGQPGTKPTQLTKPVPGADLDAAFNQALDQVSKSPPQLKTKAGEGDSSFNQALDKVAPVTATAAAPESEPGIVGQGLDYLGRGLDYGGGLARAGVFSAVGALNGKPDIVTYEDSNNIIKGKGPSSEEYLKRLGVNEGFSVDIPKIGKITQRGVEGFALDVVTDPALLLAKAIKQIPFLAKLLNGPGQAAEAVGEAVYKSAFPEKAKDAATALLEGVPEAGLTPRSPVGGTAKLAQAVEDTSNVIGKLRQGLYDRATERGVTIDAAYPLKRAEAVLEEFRRDPGLTPTVETLQELLDRYKNAGKVSLDVASEWKTNLYDTLSQSFWDGKKGLKPKADMFRAALAADFREAIAKAGNTAEKGLGDSINALNEKWGSLLSATRPLEKATQATGGKLGQMIDGAVLASSGLKGAAIKKGYELATSPYMKTVVGNALMQAGKEGLRRTMLNRAIINARGAKIPSALALDQNATAPTSTAPAPQESSTSEE